MSSGGILQLVAIGEQNRILNGDARSSLWRFTHTPTTQFAMETMPISFNGQPALGREVLADVPRNGDLLHTVQLELVTPELTLAATTNVDPGDVSVHFATEFAHAAIEHVGFDIGGNRVDRHYGRFLSLYAELALPASKADGFGRMIGDASRTESQAHQVFGPKGFHDKELGHGVEPKAGVVNSFTLYCPLRFWFCRRPGLALAVISLQFHRAMFQFQFARPEELLVLRVKPKAANSAAEGTVTIVGESSASVATNSVALAGNTHVELACGGWSMKSIRLLGDFVHLESGERKMLAKSSHTQLIEQLQYSSDETVTDSAKTRLNFTHPIKHLIWSCQPVATTATVAQKILRRFDYQRYGPSGPKGVIAPLATEAKAANPVAEASIQVNGSDRFAPRSGEYFNLVQPFNHFPNVPRDQGVNVYSFALHPLDFQPSATLNFSRVDAVYLNQKLVAKTGPAVLRVWAVGYNSLHYTSGMAGVSYS